MVERIAQNTINALTSVLIPYKVFDFVIVMRSFWWSWWLVFLFGRALTSWQDLGCSWDIFCNCNKSAIYYM